jgi:hypothetical protein
VILPPELAEPLDGQGIRGNDETSFDLAGMHQAIEDQCGFDRLAKPDLVGEEPSDWFSGGRTFRHIELMRKKPDATAEERAQPVSLAQREEMKGIEPRQEIADLVEGSGGEAFDERPLEIRLRPRIDRNQSVGVGSESERRSGAREFDDERTAFDGRDSSDSELRVETMSEVVALIPVSQPLRGLARIALGGRTRQRVAIWRGRHR